LDDDAHDDDARNIQVVVMECNNCMVVYCFYLWLLLIFLDGGNYEDVMCRVLCSFSIPNMIMLVACANLENERLRDDGEVLSC